LRPLVFIAVLAAGAVLSAPAALAAGPSTEPAKKRPQLTATELADIGFTVAPNTTDWGMPVRMSAGEVPRGTDIIISGKAPDRVPVGKTLRLARFYPFNKMGLGEFRPLNIKTVVGKGHRFSMRFQLGYPGVWGYHVGYETKGAAPEFFGFEFQVATPGTGKRPSRAIARPVSIDPKTLWNAGFTKVPNTSAWGGTARISTSSAKAGAPVTISGKAPASVAPGDVLALSRFIATDKRGSGHFEPLGGAETAVKSDGSYSLTMELSKRGLHGYSLGIEQGGEWVGVEFQVRTT
jgi:hypothetical protein